jgi:formylglycine-generating enzyme required for sulfatase activity
MMRSLLVLLGAMLVASCAATSSLRDVPTRILTGDCAGCADLAIIPVGQFIMGAEGGEEGRPEGPPHAVKITRPFALAVTEVTNAQFARFVSETGYQVAPGCKVWPEGSMDYAGASWQAPGYGRPPLPDEPVACISWTDAQAFISWMRQRTGKAYRLPTEAEWEYAARAGSTTAYPWGDDAEQGCSHANLYDASAAGRFSWPAVRCADGAQTVAPVGRYRANAFGLFDMIGNVWEWTQDCYVIPYPPARENAAAIESTSCARRTVRGGSWMTRPDRNRVTFRGRDPADTHFFMFGFRLARDLTARETAGATP